MAKKPKTPEEVTIEARVRQRLVDELAAGGRGAAAALCRKTKISTAHMTNVTTENRSIGIDVRRKLAAHWGMSLAQLEAWALGKAEPFAPAHDPPIGTLLKKVGELDGLSDELDAHPEWRTSTIARAVLTKWDSPDGLPRGGWHRALASIESGEADRVVGGAVEAISIGKHRAGKRRPMPRGPAT